MGSEMCIRDRFGNCGGIYVTSSLSSIVNFGFRWRISGRISCTFDGFVTAMDCRRTKALKPRDKTESFRCKEDAVLFTAVCLLISAEEQLDPEPVVPFDVGPELPFTRPSSLICLLRSIS